MDGLNNPIYVWGVFCWWCFNRFTQKWWVLLGVSARVSQPWNHLVPLVTCVIAICAHFCIQSENYYTAVYVCRVVQSALSRGQTPEVIGCLHCDVVISLARGLLVL